jgi:hypothetical protein
MKNIHKISLLAIIILLAPFSLIIGQDKKTEQKIKIITVDQSGNKVMIDTVFTGKSPESIKLKDGSVVYIKHGEEGSDMIHSDGDHHVFVTSTSSGNKDSKITREITVIASDSAEIADDHGDVMLYTNSGPDGEKGNVHYKVVSKSTGSDDNQVYYINKSPNHGQESNDTFTVFIDRDDSSVDKSRYVIAKDGMVVTIEGTDEAKTKALAKEIEEKLGVNNDKKEQLKSK